VTLGTRGKVIIDCRVGVGPEGKSKGRQFGIRGMMPKGLADKVEEG
jgi:hypothetical protein